MKTTTSNIKVTVSSEAGRVLLALLLSHTDTADTHQLSLVANVKRTDLLEAIDELRNLNLPGGVGTVVELSVGAETSSSHRDSSSTTNEEGAQSQVGIGVDACRRADQTGDRRAQALALVDAWKYLYPETSKVQELSAQTAKEWIKKVSERFPGREATTVFGWMSGVDDAFLKTREFPKAWVNKIVVNNSERKDPVQAKKEEDGDENVMEVWRTYAKKVIKQGGTHGSKNGVSSLTRIAQAVERGSKEP